MAGRDLDGRDDVRGRHALAVAGFVAKYGVAGNWLWWNGAFSAGPDRVLLRPALARAGVLTDVEFAELRYGGSPAAVLRGFRALYLAMPINLIIMGWVTRAMVTILGVTLDVGPWSAAILLFGVTALYSIFSGLWGVIVTDAFQFVVAMGGTILLAVFAVDSVGGLAVLRRRRRRTSARRMRRLASCRPSDEGWLDMMSQGATTLLVGYRVIPVIGKSAAQFTCNRMRDRLLSRASLSPTKRPRPTLLKNPLG